MIAAAVGVLLGLAALSLGLRVTSLLMSRAPFFNGRVKKASKLGYDPR